MADTDEHDARFHRLYQANFRSIQAYAVNRVGSADDAADIVADVFTAAWRRLDDIPSPPADRLWLYGTARRIISRHYRSASRLRNLVDRVIDKERTTGAVPGVDPVTERLLTAIDGLRPADREALLLVYWEELSHADAAEVLGCSVNAIGIRLYRAKTRLRKTLETGARPPALHLNMNGATHGS